MLHDSWAAWCGPCIASVGEIRDLVRDNPEERLVVVSISGDQDEKAWRTFVDRQKLSWPQPLDAERHTSELFSIHALPTHVLIDGEGIVRRVLSGANAKENLSHRFRSALRELS